MSLNCSRKGAGLPAADRRILLKSGRHDGLGCGGARRGELFGRAEMDSHLWTEALRAGEAARRTKISEEVMRHGARCLRQGRCWRLVCGPLAGCLGILLPGDEDTLRLHIIRRWDEPEYVESVH